MSEGYAGDVLFSLGIPLLFYSELCGLRIYSLRIDFAIPISKPLNSANPRRRPMQEYPGLVFFFRSSTIWWPWSGRIGMDTCLFCCNSRKAFITWYMSTSPSRWLA